MADGGKTLTTAQNLDDSGHSKNTTCTVCLEQFKHPKRLPCFHTFCAECVNQPIDEDGTQCPLCKKKCELAVPENDVLPNNFFIADKIEHKLDKEPSCDTCEDNPPSKKFCYDCEQYLCPNCFKMHQVFRSTRTHRICETAQRAYCAKHKDEVLLFLCKECNERICRNCKITNHEMHDTIDLEDYRNETNKQIEDTIRALEQEEKSLENQRLAANEYSKAMDNFISTTSDKTESARKELHGVVNEHCDAFNRVIDEQTAQHKIQLAEYNTKMTTRFQDLARKKTHLEFVLKQGITSDIVESSTYLLQKKQECVGERDFQTMKLSFPQIISPDVAVTDLEYELSGGIEWKHLYIKHVSVDRISNFSIKATSTMHIGKLQVAKSDKCYIHLKNAHALSAPMNVAHNMICCNESGKVTECQRNPGLIDIVLAPPYLYKIFCGYQFTSGHYQEHYTMDHDCDLILEWFLVVPECACSFKDADEDVPPELEILRHKFKNFNSKITSLNHNGQVIGYNMKTKFSRRAMPSAACCLPIGDIPVICVCYPDEHLVAMYTQSGEERSVFSSTTHVSLPSNFHPSALAHDKHFMYVTDYANDALYAFDVTTSVVRSLLSKDDGINRPTAVCVDMKGRIWVGHNRNQISIFNIRHTDVHESSANVI